MIGISATGAQARIPHAHPTAAPRARDSLNRRFDHALPPEFPQQSPRTLERAAVDADIFPTALRRSRSISSNRLANWPRDNVSLRHALSRALRARVQRAGFLTGFDFRRTSCLPQGAARPFSTTTSSAIPASHSSAAHHFVLGPFQVRSPGWQPSAVHS